MIPVLVSFGLAFALGAACRPIQNRWLRYTARLVGFVVGMVVTGFLHGLIVSVMLPGSTTDVVVMSGIRSAMIWWPFACFMVWLFGIIGRRRQRKKAERQSAGLEALRSEPQP